MIAGGAVNWTQAADDESAQPEKDDDRQFCEECDSRIRSLVQQGADRCITCQEGAR